MKKISLILLAALAFSCQEKKEQTPGITANIDNVADGTKVYLAKLGENGQPVAQDTVEVQKGKFQLDLPETDFQTLNVLTIENLNSNVLFINENEALKATIYKDSLRSSEITGGKNNALFAEYVDHLIKQSKKIQKLREQFQDPQMRQNPAIVQEVRTKQQKITEKDAEFRKQLINENPNSLVSILILSDIMKMKMLPANEMGEMYAGLSEEVKNSIPGKEVEKFLEKASKTAIGSKAPNFSAPTPDGEMLSLKDAMGKITIIDFWASWCKPCRIENPNVVKVYNKYHEKGLNIIGVSLDKPNQKDKWLKAIKDDNLTWQHVSNLQFWRDPIIKNYNVSSIPATFVLDENGVIIAKDVRGNALEEKMAELFAEIE
ncbi:TlpA disulfide reductase family protein [Mesonia aquimarina]|uniref:TlpA disulfide reductase family protein n=1 Tax=Mesonia aquimarina TaxID=1504967 RepID=UPI000EF5CD24|nr:TlpA disulfide reductase family protein [Mesonia aquimarina]